MYSFGKDPSMPPVRELSAHREAARQFRKVASALRAIAAANLGHAERVRAAATTYEHRVETTLATLSVSENRAPTAETIVAFVAEGGFCGSIDDAVFKRIRRISSAATRTILVGRRGARRARDAALHFSEALPMAAHIADFDERIAAVSARISPDETALFLAPSIHGGAQSIIERTVGPRTVLDGGTALPLTNQPISDLVRALNRESIHATIALMIAECFSAENIVRFRLMDSACRRADETSAALTAAINHARDAQISEDIFEIFMADSASMSVDNSAQ